MIIIYLGNVGSGKTACAVRDLVLEPDPQRLTFSNIKTKKVKNNIMIDRSMIIDKEQVGEKRSGEPIYKFKFNAPFWQDVVSKTKKVSVVIDEAHTILSARRGMSKESQCMLDFLALIRRVIGQDPDGQGKLVLISQLERRLDIIAKEMCNQVRYHVCHYIKTCGKCGFQFRENNEVSELQSLCPNCKHYVLRKSNHVIEVWHFSSMDNFIAWKYIGRKKTYSSHYMVTDIRDYFNNYDTLQWESLLSE